MPANISSTFSIVVDEAVTAGTTVANPGRAFRVVGVYVTGLNLAQFILNKNSAIGVVVAQTTLATGDLNDFPCELPGLTVATLTFNATDNLFLRSNVAGSSRVVIVCEAANPQALIVT